MRASPALLLVRFSLWSAFICYLAFCRLTSAATIGMFCVNICLTESNLSREESATDCLGNRLWQQRHYSSINVFSFSVLSVYHIWRPRRYAKWDRLRKTRMAMASQLERTNVEEMYAKCSHLRFKSWFTQNTMTNVSKVKTVISSYC